MHHVYILKSKVASKVYVGESGDTPDERTAEHNAGKSTYISRYRPWELVSYMTFFKEAEALKMEVYLKTGAGRSFIKKYLIPESHT